MNWLPIIRWWVPGLVCLAGIVAFAIEPTVDGAEKAVQLIGAGLAIVLFNVLVRIGNSGDRERGDEDAARRFLDEHGHWPDEAPPPRTGKPPARRPSPHRTSPPPAPRGPHRRGR